MTSLLPSILKGVRARAEGLSLTTTSVINGVVTLFLVVAVFLAAKAAFAFLVSDAVGGQGTISDCRATSGACWPFIWAKLHQFVFGTYPRDESWRAMVAMSLPPAALAAALRLLQRPGAADLAIIFIVGLIVSFSVLTGGLFLSPVATERWGGLTLTLMISYTGLAASLPLGLFLALARRSSWPVPRWLSICFIEFWRGVPLVAVLFMASVMLPLFLPEGVSVNKLARALVAVGLFAAAYMAEAIRGGLQSLPQSQYESAETLGFSYAQMLRLIILPQALRNALPGIAGTFIGLVKDTTLVLVIGLFDFLGMIQLASQDPAWAAPSTAVTGYIFAALVFWCLCFAISRVSAALEWRRR